MVETNGKIVWSGEYDAFGNCEVGVETVVSNLRLPGQYYDAETGLYYNLNRYYDPKIGRYLQPDPAGDGLNPYTYVGGNPVNAIDPEGLCALRIVGGGADIWAGIGLIGGALSGPPGWLAVGAGIVGGLTVLNGADNLIAGGRSAISGEYTRSFGEAAIHRYVQNDLAADLLYTGSQLLLGYAGIRADRALGAARAAGITDELVEETVKRTRIVLDNSLNDIGAWQPGSPNILINRSNVRQAARMARHTIGQELQITAYHEAFHRGFYSIDKLVSRLLRVNDIYGVSYDAFIKGVGKGRWFRMEEWAAETYGKTRMLLRQRYGIK